MPKKKPKPKTLPKILRAELKSRDWTHKQLADHLGVTEQAIWRWLNGAMPSKESKGKLSRRLGVVYEEGWRVR